MEGVFWLHLKNDVQHINVAELDAIFKGVNVALQWKATELHLFTDSACGYWTLSQERPGYTQRPRARCLFKGGSAPKKS